MPKLLKELVQKHCPDGVEWKTIGEIATEIYKGSEITKHQVSSEGSLCIGSWEIHGRKNIFFEKCVSRIDENLIKRKKYINFGDLIFMYASSSKDKVGDSYAYLCREKVLVGENIAVIRHNQDPGYMAYVLSNRSSKQQILKLMQEGATAGYVMMKNIKKIRIPLPPIPIQERVVKVLENFRRIEIEIENEISERKKQYKYYKEKLFRLGGLSLESWFIWKTLLPNISWGMGYRRNSLEQEFPLAFSMERYTLSTTYDLKNVNPVSIFL